MEQLKIVSVVNDFDKFNRCIKDNPFVNKYEICAFDNTVENIGISERYNSFIDKIKPEDDYWIAFLHQDFMFYEDPLAKLESVSKDDIYGAIGVLRPPFFLQFKPKFILKIYRRCLFGNIAEGEGARRIGNAVCRPQKVNTLDCCCFIVHSSLFTKTGMRFDENLKFHMYVEDFCIVARKKKITPKVIQFDCRHLSHGTISEELHKSARYVKLKHKLFCISSTCYK